MAAVLLLAAVSVGVHADTYTYKDLIHQLTDLESLALAPKPGVKCAQWSSYDRASRYDEATGEYLGWDANGDGHGIIRREGDKQVFAEIEGPGVIWRIWSAAPQEGRVRIYLDGSAEPAVDLRFSQYFDNSQWPFVHPPLVHDAASGKNLYVPIPFMKSCKVIADDKWGAYYHFTYTTYPNDTVLPVFSRNLKPDEVEALEAANLTLTQGLGTDPAGVRPGQRTARASANLRPGKTLTVARLKGERAVTALRVNVDGLSDRTAEILAMRQLALKITFDGDPQPSVWAPLGDFFGTAPGINTYKSLPMGMTPDGCYSFWFMPFAREAVVEIVNVQRATMPGFMPNGTETRSARPRRGAASSGPCSPPKGRAAMWASTCMSGTQKADGGAKATRCSTWTARSSPRPSVPAPKTTSAMPGAIRPSSTTAITISRTTAATTRATRP